MSKINLSINSNVFHSNKLVTIKKHIDLKNIMVENINGTLYIVPISELSNTQNEIINQENLTGFTNE